MTCISAFSVNFSINNILHPKVHDNVYQHNNMYIVVVDYLATALSSAALLARNCTSAAARRCLTPRVRNSTCVRAVMDSTTSKEFPEQGRLMHNEDL